MTEPATSEELKLITQNSKVNYFVLWVHPAPSEDGSLGSDEVEIKPLGTIWEAINKYYILYIQ